MEKDTLVRVGYFKMVQREDEKLAAMTGLQTKQLMQPGVEKHLADFDVDPESASHTQLTQLSGDMKVKALVLAIKECKGGVLISSHNKEFGDGVATVKCIMKGGYLRIEGGSKAKRRRSRPRGTSSRRVSLTARGTRSM